MHRSTLAVLLLAGMALAACAKKSSLYLDSGRSESSEPSHSADTRPTNAAMASTPANPPRVK